MFKRGFSLFMSVVLCATMLIGCAGKNENTKKSGETEKAALNNQVEKSKESEKIVLKDQAGREVTLTSPAQKVVSGYYISTSACVALGLKDKLVGTEDRGKRPFYTLLGEKFNALPNVGTAKEFNLEGCIALKPDLVILPIKLKDSAESMTNLGIPVILVNPENKEKLEEAINLIAKATGTEEEAKKLITAYKDSSTEMSNITKGLTENQKPKVYMGGTDSHLTTVPKDMYQATLINMAGGKNAGDILDGSSWTKISYEQITAMNPDVIIIPSEAKYTSKDILEDKQLSEITAVKKGAIYHMPSKFEAWDSPVPSCVLGSKWILATLHQDLYSFEDMKKYAVEFYNKFYNTPIDEKLITK